MLPRDRLERVTRAMNENDVDALLLTPGASMFYLSGFDHGHAAERLLALVVKRDGSASWIAPTMNVPQLQAHAPADHPIRAWTDAETYLPALKDAVAGARTVAFDDEARAAFLMDLTALAPGANIRKASTILRPLRARKTADELARLRAAGKVVDATIPQAIALCRPGRTEAEIDAELRRALLQRAPDQTVAFTIIASGPNAALPHHETASRKLQQGDVVICDFGTREPGGYHSDITVTCPVGQPADPEVHKVYRTVWQAQRAAIDAVRPGATCESIDRAARAVIEAAG